MNYIQHLNVFFLQLQQKETRLKASHISLYMALFQCWNYHRFENPFPLFRERLLKLSGISSKTTYLKCLKQLHQFGYIVYYPALNRYHKPKVSLVKWAADSMPQKQLPLFQGTGSDVTGSLEAKNCPVPVPDMGHLLVRIDTLPGSFWGHINKQYINSINIERETHAQNHVSDNNQGDQTDGPRAAGPGILPPSLEEVRAYFSKAGFPKEEAPRFFHHYQANGWKQGGKVPIKDWQAAANKWITYSKDIKPNPYATREPNRSTDHLHTQQHKNYSDPL